MGVTWVILRKISIMSTARQRAHTFLGRRVNFGTQLLKFIQWSYIHYIMIAIEKTVEKMGNK